MDPDCRRNPWIDHLVWCGEVWTRPAAQTTATRAGDGLRWTLSDDADDDYSAATADRRRCQNYSGQTCVHGVHDDYNYFPRWCSVHPRGPGGTNRIPACGEGLTGRGRLQILPWICAQPPSDSWGFCRGAICERGFYMPKQIMEFTILNKSK